MFLMQRLGAVTFSCTIVVGGAAAISGGHARGDVFYDNFGPGNSYQNSSGYGFGGSNPNFQQAMRFTSSGDYLLTGGEFGVSLSFGQNPSTFQITLHEDGGGLPGAVLEQVNVQVNLGPFGLPNPPVVVNFSGEALLSAGAQYWISMSASGFNDYVWNRNNTGDIGLRAFASNGGPWNAANGNEAIGAFRLEGTLVPGPSVIALLGVCACAPRRRRRRN
jgi:hypothetical protein